MNTRVQRILESTFDRSFNPELRPKSFEPYAAAFAVYLENFPYKDILNENSLLELADLFLRKYNFHTSYPRSIIEEKIDDSKT